jgi:two-component system response regulator NreC
LSARARRIEQQIFLSVTILPRDARNLVPLGWTAQIERRHDSDKFHGSEGMMSFALVADSQPIFLQGLVTLLHESSLFEEVYSAMEAESAATLAERHPIELAILEFTLPDAFCLELMKEISLARPACRFFILTSQESRDYVFKALEAGASGYAYKTLPSDIILLGIRAVLAGQFFIDRRIFPDLVRVRSSRESDRIEAFAAFSTLASREREVLAAFLKGHNNKEIALAMDIAVRTIENYMSSIYAKTRACTAVDLVRLAMRAGLFELEENDSPFPPRFLRERSGL